MDEKEKVVQQFSQSAQSYVTSPIHAIGVDLEWIKEILQQTRLDKGLDIATGAGHTALLVSEYVQEVIAVDLTPQMLQVASEQARKLQKTNITFALGDVEALPFPDAEFDLVTCRIAAHHFPQIETSLQEICRVLRTEGILILIDNYVSEHALQADLLNEIETLRDPSHHACYSLEQWNRFLTKAGFTTIEQYRTWKSSMDIVEWMNRAQTPEENRQLIFQRLQQPIAHELHSEQKIHLQKVMWICRK